MPPFLSITNIDGAHTVCDMLLPLMLEGKQKKNPPCGAYNLVGETGQITV